MADAAASKAAEATHVGSTPTFPTKKSENLRYFGPTANRLLTRDLLSVLCYSCLRLVTIAVALHFIAK